MGEAEDALVELQHVADGRFATLIEQQAAEGSGAGDRCFELSPCEVSLLFGQDAVVDAALQVAL